jgi:hypothetical protein
MGLVKSDEPAINTMDYTASLGIALNYYNAMYDNKEKRKWVMNYVGKAAAPKYADVPDYVFHTLGAVIRLKQRGEPLQEHELSYIERKLHDMIYGVKAVSSVRPDVAPVKKAPEDPTPGIVGELQGLIDEFIVNDVEPDFETFLKTRHVPAAIVKQLPSKLEAMESEIAEALEGSDKQLVEGYSNFKKSKLKKFVKLFETLRAACDQQVVTARAPRKPRVRKEKPAGKLVERIKYMKECVELGLKSVSPVGIIGATEVWVYNVKYKKLQVYRADEKLSVKGTTLVGYSVSESSAKTIRKPETVKDYVAMTKRTFAQAYKTIKCKDAAVNGRINEQCIILKVL